MGYYRLTEQIAFHLWDLINEDMDVLLASVKDAISPTLKSAFRQRVQGGIYTDEVGWLTTQENAFKNEYPDIKLYNTSNERWKSDGIETNLLD